MLPTASLVALGLGVTARDGVTVLFHISVVLPFREAEPCMGTRLRPNQ